MTRHDHPPAARTRSLRYRPNRWAFRRAVTALGAVAIAGCGGGGSTTGGVFDPPANPPPATPSIETRTADLLAYVGGTVEYVQAFSEGYSVPDAAAVDRFDDLVMRLLDGDLDGVEDAAGASGFRLLRFIDSGAGDNELYCLEERVLQGQGFYCVDFEAPNAHHISAPHPLFDRNTNSGSVVVMRTTGARFLSVSTTHRCANAAESSCSGTTSVCGESGAYKVSDAAHSVDAFFYRFGKQVHDRSPSTYTIQVHGCGSAACPSNNGDADIVARLSAGTTDDLPATELVNVLNTALNEALAPLQQGISLSCSEPSMDKRLCGTTNTLGRYVNGQGEPCRNGATDFLGSRWLHIEQNANLRQDDGAGDSVTPETLAEALNTAFERL
jgi:hypothetical protein